MARFVIINGKQINVDAIKDFRTVGDKKLQITFKSGETETFYSSSAYNDEDFLRGRNQVIQVIPNTQPLYSIWEDEEEYFTERVHFLGLCADGSLVALVLRDGYFDIPDSDSNYKGIYSEDEMLELTGKKHEQ